MNIAIDLTSLDDHLTGIERYAANMALSMLKQDTEDTFLFLCKNKIPECMASFRGQENVQFLILQGGSKLLFNQVHLPRALRKIHADAVCFFAFPMPLIMGKRKGRMIIGTIHDIGCWDTPDCMETKMVYYFRCSYRHMVKKADLIATVSEFSKRRIQEQLDVPDRKLLLTYNGLDGIFCQGILPVTKERKEMVRERYQLPEHFYLSLATLEPRKNLSLLLQAYAGLMNQKESESSIQQDRKLVLAGRTGWKMDDLLEEIKLQQGQQVVITGYIEDEDLPVLYQMADCFIFPSKYEGFGIPPLEAMSQGTPVISSDASSLPEVLGEAARYFHSEDIESLQQAILSFEKEPSESVLAMKKKGLKRCQKFSYDQEAARLLAAIRQRF